jgi:hypothetical protein
MDRHFRFRCFHCMKSGNNLSRIAQCFFSLLCALSCMCNFATTSFNLGKLLLPGESMTTCSFGRKSVYDIEMEYRDRYDSTRNIWTTEYRPIDTITDGFWCGAIDFRIGLLSHYPFGKGLEIGFLAELPTQMNTFWGVPLLQFDARLGLPIRPLQHSIYHHNIDIGWIVGGWVDNGWFAEYAGGLEIGKFIPYGNIRITRTPTDIFGQDGMSEIDFLSHHNRGWNVRTCLGVSMRLPRWVILPDFIVPEIAIYYPNSLLELPGISWHLGARWQYGF